MVLSDALMGPKRTQDGCVEENGSDLATTDAASFVPFGVCTLGQQRCDNGVRRTPTPWVGPLGTSSSFPFTSEGDPGRQDSMEVAMTVDPPRSSSSLSLSCLWWKKIRGITDGILHTMQHVLQDMQNGGSQTRQGVEQRRPCENASATPDGMEVSLLPIGISLTRKDIMLANSRCASFHSFASLVYFLVRCAPDQRPLNTTVHESLGAPLEHTAWYTSSSSALKPLSSSVPGSCASSPSTCTSQMTVPEPTASFTLEI